MKEIEIKNIQIDPEDKWGYCIVKIICAKCGHETQMAIPAAGIINDNLIQACIHGNLIQACIHGSYFSVINKKIYCCDCAPKE